LNCVDREKVLGLSGGQTSLTVVQLQFCTFSRYNFYQRSFQ